MSADQNLLQSNMKNNMVQPTRKRNEMNIINKKDAEISRLQNYAKKLEIQIAANNDDSDDCSDEDYDHNNACNNEYNIEDQMCLDFLETMTIRGGYFKLVSVKTLR